MELKVGAENELFSTKLVNDDLDKTKRSLIDYINKKYGDLNLTY